MVSEVEEEEADVAGVVDPALAITEVLLRVVQLLEVPLAQVGTDIMGIIQHLQVELLDILREFQLFGGLCF